jgi:hypothetical protein
LTKTFLYGLRAGLLEGLIVLVGGQFSSRRSEKFEEKGQEKYSQTLSPTSVDNPVHKIILPSKKRVFLHLTHVFA